MVHVREYQPDLIILDLDQRSKEDLQDLLGALLFCRRLNRTVDSAILACGTDRCSGYLALHLGADGFVRKPLDIDELAAWLAATCRRAAARATSSCSPGKDRIEAGDLVLDPARHRAMVNGQDLGLTRIEFTLLSALASQPDVLLSLQTLRGLLSRPGRAHGNDALHQQIHRIRGKLTLTNGTAPAIVAFRGMGYKLVAPSCQALNGANLPIKHPA